MTTTMTSTITQAKVVMEVVTREVTTIKNLTKIATKRVTNIREANTTNIMTMGMERRVPLI